ncbi:MAG TPA: homoserine dehydrogenase [Bacilli bacterium]|nr:homoserine dehydrogenase [Bacilli bacterium]
MSHTPIQIGLLGLGTVGSGVVKMLRQNRLDLLAKTGCSVDVKKILVRDLEKDRRVEVDPALLTQDAWEILHDPDVQVVVEVIGGEAEAKDYVLAALRQGKHVITANKDLIAVHHRELKRVADEHGSLLLYEAAVAGAVPIVRTLKQSFAADRIREVKGIVNGTTNFILSKMTGEGVSYAEALEEAQELGYAEADPHADVSGLDAARKMAILASLAFGKPVSLADVDVTGIAEVTQEDVEAAKARGEVLKLIGRAHEARDGHLEVTVAPTALPAAHPLSQVGDCYNAVYVYGEALGEAMFYGRGAGEMPTASAVVGDLYQVLCEIAPPVEKVAWGVPVQPPVAETAKSLEMRV